MGTITKTRKGGRTKRKARINIRAPALAKAPGLKPQASSLKPPLTPPRLVGELNGALIGAVTDFEGVNGVTAREPTRYLDADLTLIEVWEGRSTDGSEPMWIVGRRTPTGAHTRVKSPALKPRRMRANMQRALDDWVKVRIGVIPYDGGPYKARRRVSGKLVVVTPLPAPGAQPADQFVHDHYCPNGPMEPIPTSASSAAPRVTDLASVNRDGHSTNRDGHSTNRDGHSTNRKAEIVNQPTIAEPLDAAERKDLRRLEATVDRTAASVFEFGAALQEIRDRRLYRATHASFDQYTRDRFGIAKSYAHAQIAAAACHANVSATADRLGLRLTNESQLRPLAKLDAADQRAVIARVAKMLPKDGDGVRHVTAEVIARAVRDDQTPPEDLKRPGGRRLEATGHRLEKESAAVSGGTAADAGPRGENAAADLKPVGSSLKPPSAIEAGDAWREAFDSPMLPTARGEARKGIWKGEPRVYAQRLGALQTALEYVAGEISTDRQYAADFCELLDAMAQRVAHEKGLNLNEWLNLGVPIGDDEGDDEEPDDE